MKAAPLILVLTTAVALACGPVVALAQQAGDEAQTQRPASGPMNAPVPVGSTPVDVLFLRLSLIDTKLQAGLFFIASRVLSQERRNALELQLKAVNEVKDPNERGAKLIQLTGDVASEVARVDFNATAEEQRDLMTEEERAEWVATCAVLVNTLPEYVRVVSDLKPAVSQSYSSAKARFDQAPPLQKVLVVLELARLTAMTETVGVASLKTLGDLTGVMNGCLVMSGKGPAPSPVKVRITKIVLAAD